METKERTITDLLEEWAELEPERCEKQHRSTAVDGSGGYRVRYGERSARVTYEDQVEPSLVPFIQAAVQEAIAARDWHMSITRWEDAQRKTYAPEYKPEWHARVADDAQPFPKTSGKAFHDDMAHALLSAYVEALREVNDAD